ncbi:MAG: hypothetical protein WBC34_16740 [Thiofilum sp.]
MQKMKMYTLKFYLIALGFTFVIPAVNAQFDDVYYDPDNTMVDNNYNINDSDSSYSSQDDVTYYDNDEYQYYDDYDYYYSSRIKRFYRPSYGAEFYDPYYVDSYNYDPFYNDSYYYPGATIYLSFGNSSYWDYRNWRRWNRWNSFHHFNNWCLTPTNYYYAYNNWCSPSSNYWGGYNGYYSYSNYYNNYYNSCPFPVSNYYGITHSTVTNVNTGGSRGTYYGPRITGNTGSSPRGPIANPGIVQPTYKDKDSGFTKSNDKPRDVAQGVNNGRIISPSQGLPGTEKSPINQTGGRNDNPKGVPVDKEIKRETTSTTPTRPVFRPYPANEKPNPVSSKPTSDKPAYTPESPSRDRYSPSPTQNRPESNRTKDNNKPSYNPTPRGGNERPSYTPPQRNNGSGNDSRPSSSPTPTPRHQDNRSNDRPSYSPPQRNNDSGRSNDRSNASPSTGNHNSSGGGSNRSEPSRSSSPSSGSSPRGKG